MSTSDRSRRGFRRKFVGQWGHLTGPFFVVATQKNQGEVCCGEDTQDPGGISWGIFWVTKVIRGLMALPWTIHPSIVDKIVIFWKLIQFNLWLSSYVLQIRRVFRTEIKIFLMLQKQLKQGGLRLMLVFSLKLNGLQNGWFLVGRWKIIETIFEKQPPTLPETNSKTTPPPRNSKLFYRCFCW